MTNSKEVQAPQLSVLLDKLNGKIYLCVSNGPFDIKNPTNLLSKLDLDYPQAFELGLTLLENFKLAFTQEVINTPVPPNDAIMASGKKIE